jgi:hypothetical protein
VEQTGRRLVPENQHQIESFELLDYRVAEAWARAGNYDEALVYLQQEVNSYVNPEGAYSDSKGGFLDNTRNPYRFAWEVFALHSEIMAHTGIVREISGSGYKVFDVSTKEQSPMYAFVHEPVEEEEGGVRIDGLGEDEQRQLIEMTAPNEKGHYQVVSSAQVVSKRNGLQITTQSSDGKPQLCLTGVTKFFE